MERKRKLLPVIAGLGGTSPADKTMSAGHQKPCQPAEKIALQAETPIWDMLSCPLMLFDVSFEDSTIHPSSLFRTGFAVLLILGCHIGS